MESISSYNLILAFQIIISVLVLVIVGYFYVKVKNNSKQADLTNKEDDLPPVAIPPTKTPDNNPPLPTAVPIVRPPEKNLHFIYQCPSCGAEMDPGSEFCEACDYGMK